MRLAFRSHVKLKDAADVFQTTLDAVDKSTDVFPPLKSAVGVVGTVWNVSKRINKSKSNALELQKHTDQIMGNITVSLHGTLPPPHLQERLVEFEHNLSQIRAEMETLRRPSNKFQRLIHLNRNEALIGNSQRRLDEEYHDFEVSSDLRQEIQHREFQASLERISATVTVQYEEILNSNAKLSERIKILIISHVFFLANPRYLQRVICA